MLFSEQGVTSHHSPSPQTALSLTGAQLHVRAWLPALALRARENPQGMPQSYKNLTILPTDLFFFFHERCCCCTPTTFRASPPCWWHGNSCREVGPRKINGLFSPRQKQRKHQNIWKGMKERHEAQKTAMANSKVRRRHRKSAEGTRRSRRTEERPKWHQKNRRPREEKGPLHTRAAW